LHSRKAQEVTSFFPNTDEPDDATFTPIINAFPVTRTMPVATLATAAAALASGTFQVVGFVDAAWNIYDKIVDGKVISDEKKMELRLLIESLEEIKEELEDKQEVFEANTAAFSVELQHLQKADVSREQAHDKAIATLERALQDAYRDGTASLVRAHTKAITDLKEAHAKAITDLKRAHEQEIHRLREDLQSVPSQARHKRQQLQRPEGDTFESLRISKIAAATQRLPPGWETGFSSTHNREFYFNQVTRESTWEIPSTAATTSVASVAERDHNDDTGDSETK
jgi:WW domain